MALINVTIYKQADYKALNKKIDLLQKTLNEMSKKVDDINALLTEINDSTNNIAADLDRIADQAEGGLTANEADSVVAQLRSASDALKAVAARNPETTEPGTPEPTPGA